MVNKFFYSLFLLITISICISAQETGKATYYGKRMHGRNTSSGVKYHNDSLTCAHRTYPFGTLLKVKNLKNNKEVIVKVTDRGPYSKRIIIDLSYSAAKAIDLIRDGIAPVEVSLYTDIQIPLKPTEGLVPQWENGIIIPAVNRTPSSM